MAKDVPCVDSECIDTWQKATGKCFKCEDFAEDYCGNDADFMRSCPKSCKLCSGKGAACLDDYKTSVCLEYKSWGRFCDGAARYTTVFQMLCVGLGGLSASLGL